MKGAYEMAETETRKRFPVFGARRRVLRLLAGGVAVLVVVLAVLQLGGLISNPFQRETQDRSGPVLVKSITDLSRYEAATGSFQVVVDIEHDIKHVPSAIAGQRTLFVAAGTVDAYVDFAGLSEKTIKVDEEKKTVQITLPQPQLERANLDQEHSYVFSTKQGLLDKIGNLFGSQDQQEFYVVGAQKIDEAAKQSELLTRAKANTQAMLTNLVATLGYKATFTPTP